MKNFMREHKILNAVICIVVLVISLFLIITGQPQIGITGTIKMLIGLLGLVSLLGYYNSFYK